MSKDSARPGFADYFDKRGRMCFWGSQQIAYRIGAVLAIPLGRMGISPNLVTILSLLVTVGCTSAAVLLFENPILQAVGIWVGLGVGYALDCADGMLARVHKSGSLFGAIFDKINDVISISLGSAILVAAAMSEFPWGDERAALLVFAACLGTRLALAVGWWLKEFVGSIPDREERDSRARTPVWWLRRIIGETTDYEIYTILIALSWAFGCFWQFYVAFHMIGALVLLAFIFLLYRESGPGKATQEIPGKR